MKTDFEMKTPVLLIMFNRPHKAAQVFEKIRQMRPPKMFIVVDGARPDRPGEAEKVQQCRAFADLVDWKCDFKVNFAEKNMGCRNRVSSGITWAFEHVEELIILEDDCVPNLSFFPFCQELLERYRNDNRVFSISGSNRDRCEPFEESYAFSKRFGVWGWATWKRAWSVYDVNMNQWKKFKLDKYITNIFRKHDRILIQREYQMAYDKTLDTWDYVFGAGCFANHALHIVPRVNLIKNIGFNSDSTHGASPTLSHLYMDETIEFPLIHPEIMSPSDRLITPPPAPLSEQELEKTFVEHDATFKELLNFEQWYAVIILFKKILRQRITDMTLTGWHLQYSYYAALAYSKLGDYEHARTLIEILLTFDPQNTALLNFMRVISTNKF